MRRETIDKIDRLTLNEVMGDDSEVACTKYSSQISTADLNLNSSKTTTVSEVR